MNRYKSKTAILQLRVSPEMKNRAKRLAEQEGSNITNYIEQLLIRAEQEKKQRTAA